MNLSIDSFALKILKKSEELAFTNKAKFINISIPEKIKIYIEKNLDKEIKHYKKKYKLEFNLISDKNLILPEYKIDLLNKNKKTIHKVENIEKIEKNFIHEDRKKKELSNFKLRKNFSRRSKFKKRYGFQPKKNKNFNNRKFANY